MCLPQPRHDFFAVTAGEGAQCQLGSDTVDNRPPDEGRGIRVFLAYSNLGMWLPYTSCQAGLVGYMKSCGCFAVGFGSAFCRILAL